VLPHNAQLKAYLHGAFPSVRDVDDVVQESFVRVWIARTAPPIRCARGFLFRVAQRLALDQVRRNRISPVVAVGDLAALSVVEDGPNAASLSLSAARSRWPNPIHDPFVSEVSLQPPLQDRVLAATIRKQYHFYHEGIEIACFLESRHQNTR